MDQKNKDVESRQTKTEYQRALDSLTRYLASRDHSRGELRTKLSRRFDEELVQRLLDEAEARGWLASDESVSERAVAALIRRNKSHRYIQSQLRKRHLPVPNPDLDAELSSARALVEKKFGASENLSFEDKRRAQRYLAYRGFASSTIRKVLQGKGFD